VVVVRRVEHLVVRELLVQVVKVVVVALPL
jgi:hypothetical protein